VLQRAAHSPSICLTRVAGDPGAVTTA
jgi:hypothetical protein